MLPLNQIRSHRILSNEWDLYVNRLVYKDMFGDEYTGLHPRKVGVFKEAETIVKTERVNTTSMSDMMFGAPPKYEDRETTITTPAGWAFVEEEVKIESFSDIPSEVFWTYNLLADLKGYNELKGS
jgi:hypothetical protein